MVQNLFKNWLLGFKNHMRNLDNFRQAVESPKRWGSMCYFCPKNTFLQLKHIQRIYLTLLSSICAKIHQILYVIWNRKLFFTAELLFIRRAHLQTFPLRALKFIKFLKSVFKQKVRFSSKFCVTRDNSSVLFIAETFSAIDKRSQSKCKFSDFRLLA